MQPKVQEVLSDTFSSILREFAYILTERVPDQELGSAPGEMVDVRMTFRGPLQGEFRLLVSPDACREVAANFLGFDEEDDFVNAHLEDGAKELINIVGGNVLGNFDNGSEPYVIGIPSARRFDPGEWEAIRGSREKVVLRGDERLFILFLSISGRPEA
ncbi:MAG: hypothetical protein A2428_01845 [Bdellovibrionales bacterium RIFOXYC1_FULL_54_43]|nr:MAG: hypothetical protein A2428_01845 [Bdellovibrionales bacterium RIFOXYC1_FULL_54_43]OFZ81682.1 MAG: hypothetical protein A2603_12055 [Bdellovibrionales bacterium RIFOXYD1_FULL_55_31]